MKKSIFSFYKILLVAVLLFGFVKASGQTTIFNVAGGGAFPTGWAGNNPVVAEPIDKGSYYLVEAGSPSDNIVTAVYNLSAYSTATLTLDVATFGSGGDNPAKIEISYNGTTYSQTTTTNTPTSTSYVSSSIALSLTLTSTVKIRISNNGTSGRGVRLQNIKLVATAPSCSSPTTQASIFTSSSIAKTTATAGWTRGTGNNVLVVARAGSAVNADPVSGTDYTANTAFGSGTQIGTGNYVVYNGTGTSVSLTALTAGMQYHFAVYEYNTTGTCYNTTELTGNFTTLYNAPAINSSLTASGNVGSSFSYTITATNTPTSFSATGLPAGLSIDTATGIISGTPTTAATTNVTIGATNIGGSDSKTLVITFGAAVTNCINETFTGWSHGYGDWTETSNGIWTAVGTYAGGGQIQMNDLNNYLELPPLNNPSSLQYSGALSSNESITNGNRIKVQYYNGSSWVDIVEHTATTTTFNTYTADLSALSSQTGVRVRLYRSANNRVHYIDNVVVTCQVSTDPKLTVNAGTLDFGTVCNGSSSAQQSFTISGSYLTAGNISLAALAGYSYSETSGGTFTSTLSFSQSGGTLAAKTIYVKLTPTATNATYNGNIVISGGGASDVNKAVTGNSTAISGAVVTNTANSVAQTTATLRATSSTFSTCPATSEKGFVYAITSVNSTPVNGGTGVTKFPLATLGSGGAFTQAITGLTEGTTYTYQAYLFDGATYIYGGFQTFTTTFTGTLSNVTATKACLVDTSGTISWTAATGTTPTGYMVFAVPGATTPSGTMTTALTDYSYADANYASLTNDATPSGLGKLLYKGNGASVNITGLTENANYSFLVLSYQDGGTIRRFSNGAAGGRALDIVAQDDVKTFTGTPSNNQVTLNWTNNGSTSCFDEVLIVANQGAVVFTPTGDGSSYIPNDVYSGPNQVVYKGIANTKSITGLTNGTEYCFKIFVRRGTTWSAGTSVCATPDIVYCASQGSTTDATGITQVEFNTINQSSTGANAYTDYTAVSTSVNRGDNFPLTVHVNTAGDYTVYTKAWIDWNHNGDFNDSGEEYDLGITKNKTNGITSLSPKDITIPIGAFIGDVRMRISAKFNSIPTSCESFSYGEVEDYTFTINQPANAEINVRGAGNTIPNGADTPYAFNNTIFIPTPLNTDSPEKEFFIENLGIANLNLTGTPIIKIEGTNAGDFIVTQQATGPVVNGTPTSFKIKFHPTVAGLRSANVRIDNNDSNEDPYIFAIQGTGNCTTEPTVDVFPTSGPANTLVTFSSVTSNLLGATVTYNNTTVPITYQTAGTLEVLVPANANDGNFIIQLATGCSKTSAFDVIDTDLTSCEASGGGGAPASDLIIYEVYDENGGSGGVITIFNRTGVSVDLSDYSIERAGDYGGTYKNIANLNGTIAANAVAIIGVTITPNCNFTTTGNGSFGQGFNGNDGFRLMKGATLIDDVKAPNYVGYYLKRKNTNLNPNTTYTASEWTTQAVSSGQCLSGVGVAPSVKTPPVLLTSPVYAPACSLVTLSVTGQEGIAGGNTLEYQWFALAPMSNNWISISDDPIYSGSTTANLTISDLVATDGYQFYAQIRENTATCYIASNATKVELQKTTWTSSWSNGLPTVNSNIIIAGTYNTQVNGSLDVCRLTVNAPGSLLIKSGAPVKVKNKITNNSTADNFVIETGGSLIQEDIVTNTGSIKAERSLTNLGNVLTGPNAKMDYVFWSSPVTPQNIQNFTPGTPANRLFEYKESTDRFVQTGNVNFVPAKGYALRAETGGVSSPSYDKVYNFQGVPNNGNYSILLTRSADAGTLEHGYNLVGNPYPSNLSFDELYNLNSTLIYKTAWFWTNTTYTASQLGSNYNGNNYAVYNGTGGNGATVPANVTYNAIIPDGKVAVGQAFLVQLKNVGANQTLTFKNKNGANFLRIAGDADFYQKNSEAKNRYWLKLISPNNLQNSQLIGYIQGATNGYEQDYDARAISSTSSNLFYSVLENEKLIIQGKGQFNIEDKVKLGANIFENGNYIIGLFKKEGIFDGVQKIYLKDYLLNIITDLSANDYSFNADAGTSEGRFEIVYEPQSTLATDDSSKNEIQVYRNGDIFIVQSGKGVIDEVEVFDASGRLFQKVKGGATKISVNGATLVSGMFILKIKRNSETISKKILK